MDTPKQKKHEGSSSKINCKRKDNKQNNGRKKRRRITFEIDNDLPEKLTEVKQNSTDNGIISDNDIDNEDEAQIDLAIEFKLQECAKRNNLTPIKVKKILRKLVGNDHVLALVKLQEESEIAKEKAEKQKLEDMIKDTSDSSLKLTRSKMKALNKKIRPLPPLIETELQSDIAALISSELHSDSDGDDEYEPREEDFVSEDDLNATASDLDSQPRTPATPASLNDLLSPIRYDNDGVFKVPRERNNSLSQEEIIAQRTRSKLCLQTTAIETIESTFIPPDITPDMYDLDKDVDENWMDFLTSFALNQNTPQEDDDPDADPEYIAAEKIPLDAEELRDVNISKKELSDLVSELLDGLAGEGCSLGDVIEDLETPTKITERALQSPIIKSPNKKRNIKSTILDSHQDQCLLENPIQTNNLQSDPHISSQNNPDYYNVNNNSNYANDSTLSTSYNEINFVPNVISTPQQFNQRSDSFFLTNPQQPQPHSQFQPQSQTQVISQNLTPQNVFYTQTPWSPFQQNQNISHSHSHYNKQAESNYFTINPSNTVIAYPVADSTKRCFQIAQLPNKFNSNTCLPASKPILAKLQNNSRPVAYVDLTKPPKTKVLKKIKYIEHPDIYELWNNDAHVSATKYFKMFYENKYKVMENEKPKEPIKFNQKAGFTYDQINLLRQQLELHVQLAAQNYLQCYSHPQFWKLAKSEKDMLLELEQNAKGNENSVFNTWNLQKAINLVHEWESELSIDNEENKAFIEFIHNQIRRSKVGSYCQYNKILSFPPRTMHRILSSQVFMYPEYLPRLPFRANYETTYHEIIPMESHMIAFGLEKYIPEILNDIKENNHCYNKKCSLIKLAIERICKYLITGKSKRRIYNYYKQQLNDTIRFNPIQYFDKYKCAPPFENKLLPLDLANIKPPRDQFSKLPLVWQKFLTDVKYKNYENNLNLSSKSISGRKKKCELNKKEDQIKSNLINTNASNLEDETASNKPSETNVVIHLNYIFDTSILNASQSSSQSQLIKTTLNQTNTSPSYNSKRVSSTTNITDFSFDIINSPTLNNIIPPKIERRNSTTDYTKIFTKIHDSLGIQPDHCYDRLNFDDDNKSSIDNPDSSTAEYLCTSHKQALLTDYYSPSSKVSYNFTSNIKNIQSKFTKQDLKLFKRKYQQLYKNKIKKKNSNLKPIYSLNRYIAKPNLVLARKLRNRKKLIFKLQNLLKQFSTYLYTFYNQYYNKLLNKIFVKFKSLELYTNFLIELKMSCNTKKANEKTEGEYLNNASCSSSSLPSINKKIKNLDQDDAAKIKKANRLGESLKHMLLPDSKEDGYKKDAIYAYNYYEKVEEILLNSNDVNKFKKFQAILKSFDPQKDKVSDLYYKIENLLLPDYPDLVQVFLTFLLPSEAVDIGKFFEHFIVTNMGTFVQKLNIYFNKQPAQIRKIYNSLNELAEDNNVTMDKIKSKILPLLKGNQFLIDWFLQNFPDEKPPESLMTVSESMNFKEVETNVDGNICEIVPTKDLIDDSTDNQSCQLKYINGRLFYGSRILLPAKLAFMAKHLLHTDEADEDKLKLGEINTNSCIHGIKELGEKCLKGNQLEHNSSCEENDKSEEEYDIDTRDKSIEFCDESTFRLHAARLNPSLYGTNDTYGVFNNFLTNKSKEEGKTSPKKYLNRFNHPSFKIVNLNKEKGRKSPKKSTPKSPNAIISVKRSPPAETSNALNTAKKLKAMTEEIEENKNKKKTLSHKTNNQSKSLSVSSFEDESKKTENIKIYDEINNKGTITYDDVKPWTRDEDKIILEEVKIGFNSEESLVKRIYEKLNYRKINEIMERHKFLMDVLCKLQKRN